MVKSARAQALSWSRYVDGTQTMAASIASKRRQRTFCDPEFPSRVIAIRAKVRSLRNEIVKSRRVRPADSTGCTEDAVGIELWCFPSHCLLLDRLQQAQ